MSPPFGLLSLRAGMGYQKRTLSGVHWILMDPSDVTSKLKVSNDVDGWEGVRAIFHLEGISGASIYSATGTGVVDGNRQFTGTPSPRTLAFDVHQGWLKRPPPSWTNHRWIIGCARRCLHQPSTAFLVPRTSSFPSLSSLWTSSSHISLAPSESTWPKALAIRLFAPCLMHPHSQQQLVITREDVFIHRIHCDRLWALRNIMVGAIEDGTGRLAYTLCATWTTFSRLSSLELEVGSQYLEGVRRNQNDSFSLPTRRYYDNDLRGYR
ncbi:hypothetical protein BDZ89DRAFT_1151570 [Hymenopellis radicata]|nr:hypothetical protein BDZ89DRAFT_1151570 [Hymenopellis radicata]